MTQLHYTVELENGERLTGSVEAQEILHLTLPLRGTLRSVTATMEISLSDGEKIFMNGFQTWSYCPEYTAKDRIRSLRHLPKKGVEHYGLERYGDYYFVDYPNKPGLTHGESWCYFRRGETFRLVASLDEEPGYTLFSFDAKAGVLSLRRDCAGLAVDGDFHAFDLFLAEGGEDEVFDRWFAAMGVTCRTQEKMAGYSSWYNRYEDISEVSIREDLVGCAKVLEKGDLFQIDDGWESNVGDWLETDPVKFPHGLKPLADEIHARGFKAGLWLAPFVANSRSKVFNEHPDWFFLHDGEPWYCGCNWGGFYALDIDKPEVQRYLRETFRRVFEDWGFDLVKLDFLYGAAPFGNEKETRAGRMIRAMKFLREVCGDKLILGCGVPVMPAFGLVDYCRVSCDVGLDWDGSWLMRQTHRERVSTRQAIANTIFRRQLNGRAWLSDPDVFFLREENLKLTEEEKQNLCTVNALFGGMLLCSDNMGQYGDKALAAYRRTLETREAQNVRVEADEPGIVSVSYELNGVHKLLKLRNLCLTKAKQRR
ncbi:MAG: alpha-galactosidase [Oscillospiraceae bacterium]|nr:alpha-galactosidase [Oscillospiraceae bacterium]